MNYIKKLCQQHKLKQQIAEHRNKLYRMVYAWGRNSDLAHDIAQECMLKALKNVHQLRDPAVLHSWLYGILVNCWRDYFRRKRDMLDIDQMEIIDDETPERIQQRQDTIDLMQFAVTRLPEGQRMVVTLIDLEGLSYSEVSTILDIPVGTVMSRLSRARAQLAKILIPERQSAMSANTTKLRSIT